MEFQEKRRQVCVKCLCVAWKQHEEFLYSYHTGKRMKRRESCQIYSIDCVYHITFQSVLGVSPSCLPVFLSCHM